MAFLFFFGKRFAACIALVLLATLSQTAQAQFNKVLQEDRYEPGRVFQGLRAKNILTWPQYPDSASLPVYPQAYSGTLRTDSTRGSVAYTVADSSTWLWTGTQWLRFGSSSGGGADGVGITSIYSRSDSLFYLLNDVEVFWYQVPPLGDGGGGFTGFLGQPFVVWTGTGLQYYCYTPPYYINGKYLPGSDTILTLSPGHVTHPRYDLILTDTFNIISAVEGTPAANPVQEVPDGLSQLAITQILVSAGDTTGDNSPEIIYSEAVEWDTTGVGGSNYVSTGQVHSGTYAFERESTTTNNSDILQFTNDNILNKTDYQALVFKLKLKTAFGSNKGFRISYRNGGAIASTAVQVIGGLYGFDASSTAWQTIVVPFSAHSTFQNNFDGVVFKAWQALPDGFFIDEMMILRGENPSGENAVTNVYRKPGTDSVFKVINGLSQFAFIDSVGAGGGGLSTIRNTDTTGSTLAVTPDAIKRIYTDATIIRLNGDSAIGFKIDTAIMATKGRLMEAIDSLAATISAGGITQLTGDVTAGPGSGSQTATIAANAVSYAKMQQMAGLSVLGNSTNSTANMAAITGSANQLLRISGTTLAFGTIDSAFMAANFHTSGYYDARYAPIGGGGSLKLGTLNGYNTKGVKGAQLSNDTLYNQSADANSPGLIDTTDQVIGGRKSFIQNSNYRGSGDAYAMRIGGTWTGDGGSNDHTHLLFNPSITAKAFGSSQMYGLRFIPTLTASSTAQTIYGAFFSPTFVSGGGTTSMISLAGTSPNSTSPGVAAIGTAGSGYSYLCSRYGSAEVGIYGLGAANQIFTGTNIYDGVIRTGAGIQGSLHLAGGYLSSTMTFKPQSLGSGIHINNLTGVTSTVFSITSTTAGFRMPVHTTAQRDAVSSPTNGLQIYNSNRSNIGTYVSNAWGELYVSKYTLGTDANYSFDASTSFVTLSELASANRTVTLPAAATYVGKEITIKVANSSGTYTWSTTVAMKDKTDADVTALANDTVYKLFSNGTNWLITSIY